MSKKFSWFHLLWLLAPLLVWWVSRDIRLADMLQSLGRLGGKQILILLALNTGIFMLVSGRWWLLLRAQSHAVPFLSVMGYRLVAFGISYFTPGPQFGGEPAQVYYLQSRHAIPTSGALASVSLDKILELLANFTFLLVGIFAALDSGLLADLAPIQAVEWMAGPFILLLAYTLALWVGKTPLASLVSLVSRMLPREGWLRRLARAAAAAEEQIGLFCRQKPLVVLIASLISALTWAMMVLEYWLALSFLGIPVSLTQAVAVLTAASVAFLFPLPGGLGALEASQVLAMEALGFTSALGLSISLLIRGRDILLGGFGILWGGVLARRQPRVSRPIQVID
jgi:uncharacterized protein (TIRG00374 family)